MMQFLIAGLSCLAAAQDPSTAPPSIFDSLPSERAPAITGSEPGVEAEPDREDDPLAHALANMTLRQKVSQLMVVTMEGSHTPTVADLSYLKSYTPGAAIIRKILKPAYAAVYVNKLRGVEQVSGIPLWIGTNIYELSRAERRDLGQFIQLPTPLTLAAANNEGATRDVAELLAEHLSLMGFNMHLGPSLALSSTLATARGSVYSLGGDPEFTGTAFGIFREVFDAHGVLAVPTGFPGGGENRPRDAPAVLLTPSGSLAEADLAPYLSAMLAGLPILHVGNTLVPTLDPRSAPASVSEPVLNELLREQLGYTGIVIAGPMDSKDVAEILDPAVAAIRALDYGADMIYWTAASNSEMRAVDNIVLAVEEKRLSEDKINAALRRVLSYKFEHRGTQKKPMKEGDTADLAKKKKLAKRVEAVERQAITVVQNRGNILPLSKDKSMPIGVTGTVGVDTLTEGLEKHIKPISKQVISTARHVGEIKDFEIRRLTRHIRGIRTVVLVLTDTNRPGGQVELIKELQSRGIQVVVVLLGYPRNLPYLASAEAVVLGYCDPAKYEQTIAAMPGILVGEAPVGFINIPGDIEVPAGETRTYNAYDLVRVPAGRLPVTLSDRFRVGLSAPYDPRQSLKKVQWDFGDGTTSKKDLASHAFKSPGRYPVSLKVTGVDGATSEFTFQVVAGAAE